MSNEDRKAVWQMSENFGGWGMWQQWAMYYASAGTTTTPLSKFENEKEIHWTKYIENVLCISRHCHYSTLEVWNWKRIALQIHLRYVSKFLTTGHLPNQSFVSHIFQPVRKTYLVECMTYSQCWLLGGNSGPVGLKRHSHTHLLKVSYVNKKKFRLNVFLWIRSLHACICMCLLVHTCVLFERKVWQDIPNSISLYN